MRILQLIKRLFDVDIIIDQSQKYDFQVNEVDRLRATTKKQCAAIDEIIIVANKNSSGRIRKGVIFSILKKHGVNYG